MEIPDSGTGLLSMAMFALATSITPGPVNVLSFASGARFGVVRSLPYVLGATLGFVGVLLLVGGGARSVIGFIQAHSTPIALLGASYMLHLAWRIGTARGDVSSEGPAACPGLVSGLFTQTSNPKAWFVALSAVSLHVLPHPAPMRQLPVFSAVYFVVCFLSLLVWVMLGAQIGRAGFDARLVNRAMAIMLAASVLIMLQGVLQTPHAGA